MGRRKKKEKELEYSAACVDNHGLQWDIARALWADLVGGLFISPLLGQGMKPRQTNLDWLVGRHNSMGKRRLSACVMGRACLGSPCSSRLVNVKYAIALQN